MKDWPNVELTGKEFAIPRVCPNCMAPAKHGWATSHFKAGFGRGTRYTMTFYYCDGCDAAFRVKQDIAKKQDSYGPKLLALWILVSFVCFIGLAAGIGSDATVIPWLMFAAGIGGGVYFTRRMAAARRGLWEDARPPLPPNALGYDFAAYLIDTKGGVFSKKKATFAAARPEWLSRLMEANAGSVM